ncbi:hypothetical protein SDJN02_09416 [Cucurbita argyrosperma subsp. argyrosperma]|nr:hypothetical protein SDJN02_09416 [Cucurbita argyrosperma subsp. argyrosperma]
MLFSNANFFVCSTIPIAILPLSSGYFACFRISHRKFHFSFDSSSMIGFMAFRNLGEFDTVMFGFRLSNKLQAKKAIEAALSDNEQLIENFQPLDLNQIQVKDYPPFFHLKLAAVLPGSLGSPYKCEAEGSRFQHSSIIFGV